MSRIESLKLKLRHEMPYISSKYGVSNLELFGSYVHNEQRESSDLDILVEFGKTIDLFAYIELENYLSDVLGIKVDLVLKDTLKPRIRESILREAIPI
ncbi:TPA: DNA polymerase III subunit beta [bacterium]|nr:DNA polymerase III subunit beta [bacterium]